MGIFQNHLMAGAAAAASAGGASFYDHQIEQSIRLDRSSTSDGGANGSFLQRASSAIPTASNSKKFTFSTWIKKLSANLNFNQIILFAIVSGGGKNIYIDSSTSSYYDRIYSGEWGSQSYVYPSQLRDTSGWYHLAFIWDTTQGTQANRQKVYINGTLQGVGDTTNNWSLNQDVWWNMATSSTAYAYAIGGNAFGHSEGNSYGVYCYLAETIGIDGQDVSISDLGETKNGVWIPKDPSGLTFGNNGYHLKYENASDLGNDSSGNNNDFNPVNLGADHQVLDSPTFGS